MYSFHTFGLAYYKSKCIFLTLTWDTWSAKRLSVSYINLRGSLNSEIMTFPGQFMGETSHTS